MVPPELRQPGLSFDKNCQKLSKTSRKEKSTNFVIKIAKFICLNPFFSPCFSMWRQVSALRGTAAARDRPAATTGWRRSHAPRLSRRRRRRPRNSKRGLETCDVLSFEIHKDSQKSLFFVKYRRTKFECKNRQKCHRNAAPKPRLQHLYFIQKTSAKPAIRKR